MTSTADLLDHQDADLISGRRERKGRGVRRARYRVTLLEIDERRRTGGIVLYQQQVGGGAALEADSDPVDGCSQCRGGGQRAGRAIKAEEPRPRRLQSLQRNPRPEDSAAQSRRIAAPADTASGTLVENRVHGGRQGQTPPAHAR
jgi:hypothetical protein